VAETGAFTPERDRSREVSLNHDTTKVHSTKVRLTNKAIQIKIRQVVILPSVIAVLTFLPFNLATISRIRNWVLRALSRLEGKMIRSLHSVFHSTVASAHVASLCPLLALSAVLAPAMHATAIATGSIQVTNFTITPASGTVVFGGLWTAQAFAEAQNSLCGCDSQFNSSLGGTAQADAMVMFAQGHALADATSLNLSASAIASISNAGVMAANATGQPTLFNTTFSITGATGPVNVTFSATVDITQSLFTDAAGVSALSDASYALSIDGQNVLFMDSFNQIGSSSSWSNSFSGTLSDTITLNAGQTQTLVSASDTDVISHDTPEPPTGLLALLGASVPLIRRFLMAVTKR
jgi:hypothetical protein